MEQEQPMYTGVANEHGITLIKADVKRVQAAERARIREAVEGLVMRSFKTGSDWISRQAVLDLIKEPTNH